MACLGKKLYVLLALLVAFFLKSVDYSGPQFEPLRQQWQHSVDTITDNRYYTEYIVPAQVKLSPLVQSTREQYISPTINRANSIVVDKYQVYLSKHVESLIQRLTSSPVYQKVILSGSKVYPLVDTIVSKTREGAQIGSEYLAVGVVNFAQLSKHYYGQVQVYILAVFDSLKLYYSKSKPFVIEVYHSKIVPSVAKAKTKVVELAARGYEGSQTFYASKVLPFYSARVSPFIESKINSKVRPFYGKYLKTYIDIIRGLFIKYYNLLRVHSIFSLSKNLITGTYDQASEYIQKLNQNKFSSESSKAAETSFEVTGAATTEAEGTPVAEQIIGSDNLVIQAKTIADSSGMKVKSDDVLEFSLAEEISAWKSFIYSKVESLNKNFDREVDELEEKFLNDLKPQVTKLLQDYTTQVNDDYTIINKDIYSIDSKPFLLENGEEVEIDSQQRILDKKITREDFRAKLNSKKEYPSEYADFVYNFTIDHIKELEQLIDQERRTIIDIYEEFAEVAINEFSKKMMYSSFASSFNNLNSADEESENYQDWKDYIKVKNYLIDQREALISKRQSLAKTRKYLAEIQMTLKTLVHEAGNYYAVLRAKANIEFQNRERREHEESVRLDNEETPVATSTVLKYVTLTSSVDSLETPVENEVEIETPEDEEISDLESDDEDFITEDIEGDAGLEAKSESEVEAEEESEPEAEVEEIADIVDETQAEEHPGSADGADQTEDSNHEEEVTIHDGITEWSEVTETDEGVGEAVYEPVDDSDIVEHEPSMATTETEIETDIVEYQS